MGTLNHLQMVGFNSHVELGSIEGKPIMEPQDEGHSGSVSTKRNMFPVKAVVEFWGKKYIWSTVITSIKIAFLSDKINLLIPFGPLAILVDYFTGHHGWVFFLSLLGIIPLAERLGWATEQLAFYTGPTVGGLLNATFGNATELIISMYAMKHGMLRVVQQSLLGSILSNMLLVLGCAFFCGGIVHPNKQQVFNKSNAVMSSGLLLMAVMGLLFPAVLHFTHTELHFGKSELALSRFSSCIMLVAYCGYIFFQLTSQRNNSYTPIMEETNPDDGGSDDEESPDISKYESVIWLSILTLVISVLSEYLVNTIEGASVAMNIPIAFISVILLPIVGNAAEHASAIIFAVKDKLDISLGVAIGSSTQISMFAIPFCVVVGWIMGRPLDLNFQLFETATLIMTVLVVAFMLQDGTSNYFKGLMLVFCYLIVGASFFVHVDPQSIQDKP
ncbi:putative calcium/proton exchanger, sodium/calcium exchanger membrane region [Helianthus annuus]|uniref:Vacuolar cation/proton exchanger n=2 Tax=Helianthus annuus TaxID=4232 RepID=A0A251TNH7_HELAN|nr:vacuolar cation/proton exchanger 3 isoform X1 [Helianthus annuus]XP_035834585.1 vacuolar cation/proton exchanger 3 isoform X1 [Helianthus annuus]KAF5787375.1 putative calcium/proton exchanger [Helianthus annuus]KAJ0880592.1 putative calcium/proton exchanger, sodium/calcium exchanger membrane region [Helianthus annuus]